MSGVRQPDSGYERCGRVQGLFMVRHGLGHLVGSPQQGIEDDFSWGARCTSHVPAKLVMVRTPLSGAPAGWERYAARQPLLGNTGPLQCRGGESTTPR